MGMVNISDSAECSVEDCFFNSDIVMINCKIVNMSTRNMKISMIVKNWSSVNIATKEQINIAMPIYEKMKIITTTSKKLKHFNVNISSAWSNLY